MKDLLDLNWDMSRFGIMYKYLEDISRERFLLGICFPAFKFEIKVVENGNYKNWFEFHLTQK